MTLIVFTLNDRPVACVSPPAVKLLWVLREELADLSARFGCGEAQCGSCVVEIDGHAMHACDVPLWAVAERSVRTAAGLDRTPIGRALLAAFESHQAGQCGYCLSGVMMAAHVLLALNPQPSREQIGCALGRNLCRCGSHVRILAAIADAAAQVRALPEAPA